MLTSPARAAVLYNRLGRVDCRGQGRPLLPGVRGLRMRRFVTRTQCSNTTQQDTRLWDGKGARGTTPRLRTVQPRDTCPSEPQSTLPNSTHSHVFKSLQTVLDWATVGISKLKIPTKKYHSLFLKKFRQANIFFYPIIQYLAITFNILLFKVLDLNIKHFLLQFFH